MKKLYYLFILPTILGTMACMHLTSSTFKEQDLMDRLIKGQDINLKDRIIEEAIDLNKVWDVDQRSVAIASALFFQNCTFKNDIIAENKTGGRWAWGGDVIFENCHFEGEFRLTDAVFDGRVRIINCTFAKNLDLQRNTLRNAVRISGNQTGNDMLLQYSRCYHDFQSMDNRVGRYVLAQGLSVYGHLQMSNLESQGLDLGQAHFHEDVTASYLNVSKKINLSQMQVAGHLVMRDSKSESMLDSSGLLVGGRSELDRVFKTK